MSVVSVVEWEACQVWFSFFGFGSEAALRQMVWWRHRFVSVSSNVQAKTRVCQVLFLSKDGSVLLCLAAFLISASHIPSAFPPGSNASHATAATVWLPEIPSPPAAGNMYSAPEPGWGGWGHCSVDNGHQGVTLRKDLYVLSESTIPLCVLSTDKRNGVEGVTSGCS